MKLSAIDLTLCQERLVVVSLGTFLSNTTSAEDIAFFCPPGRLRVDAGRGAADAQAAGCIEAMPGGYDTLIGEQCYPTAPDSASASAWSGRSFASSTADFR